MDLASLGKEKDKWRPKKYSFVFVLIRLTSLVSTDKIQKKCSFRTRLVGLISTVKDKRIFCWPPFMHSVYGLHYHLNLDSKSRQTIANQIASDDHNDWSATKHIQI